MFTRSRHLSSRVSDARNCTPAQHLDTNSDTYLLLYPLSRAPKELYRTSMDASVLSSTRCEGLKAPSYLELVVSM